MKFLSNISFIFAFGFAFFSATQAGVRLQRKTSSINEFFGANNTIYDLLVTEPSFSNFTSLVNQSTQLTTALQTGQRTFTVFVPTNEAFAMLPPGLIDAVNTTLGRPIANSIVSYHIHEGSIIAIVDFFPNVTYTLPTLLDGFYVNATNLESQGGVNINDRAFVMGEARAPNGNILVIDRVLDPLFPLGIGVLP